MYATAPETPTQPSSTQPEAAGTEIAKEVSEKARRDAMRAALQARARKAITLAEEHPIGAIAVVTAGAALVQIELAVGILTGIGAGALFSKKNGAEARQKVVATGRWALARARSALAARHRAQPTPGPKPTTTESAPPPA